VQNFRNFICKNSRGSKKEIEDLKQKMRSHLTQTVQELIADGKNEQESIELAISRFGGKNQIQDELAHVFSVQKKFGNVILAVALIFLVVGVSFLIAERVTNNQFIKRNNDLSFEQKMITQAAQTNDLKLLDKTVKKMFVEAKKNQIAYVALVQLPDDYKFDPENPTFMEPTHLGEIKYQYPENIKSVKEFGMIGMISSQDFLSDNRYLQIGMKQYANNNQYAIFKQIGVGCIMIYWILFGIWATVKAYHLRRSNVGWIAIFFVLNVAGYLLNIIYYKFKVDRVG